ncbi:conserved hypothetical protein [Ricinus communis]|uniref:Uncharacterized protein n=1 Tax=Ricinus communis TaxID=3988 RepID=B9SNY9_RICCO|nr:conserved hypothetical protein [Ricinus communis]
MGDRVGVSDSEGATCIDDVEGDRAKNDDKVGGGGRDNGGGACNPRRLALAYLALGHFSLVRVAPARLYLVLRVYTYSSVHTNY